jgi:hypothetical protein
MRGNARHKAVLTAAVALAITTFTLSILSIYALNRGGEVRMGSDAVVQLAAGYDRRAEPMLATPQIPPPPIRQEAAALSRKATEQFPYDTSAWLRLAYVDALEHGGLTPAGVAMLQRSYDLVAVDPQVGVWRVAFALENSQALPSPLRVTVREEASTLWRSRSKRSELRKMADTIANPAGRLSLHLWLNRLDATVTR